MDIFVARQPIFDAAEQLVGYELLYRSSGTQNWAAGATQERMSSDVIINAFLGIGIERMTGGRTAFINLHREMLVGADYRLLEGQNVVFELLESTVIDDAVIAAAEQLVRDGFRLALDDFSFGPAIVPLLQIAEIVKVDVLFRSAAQIRDVAEQLRPFKVKLLAERVETREVRECCRGLGFSLFQGHYFAHPEILSKRELPVEQLTIVRLMNLLRDPDRSDVAIEDAFRADLSLSYKLLRMVNSASHGGRGIQSILHAVRLLGRKTLHRWMALLFVSSLATGSDADRELAREAVCRARLCELIAEASARASAAGTLFMVGLFSRLDALLRMPMDEILTRIDLAPEVSDALLARSGPHGAVLTLVEAYEDGAWDTVARLAAAASVATEALPELYLQAVNWARERLEGVMSNER